MIRLRELTAEDIESIQRIFSPESTAFLMREPMSRVASQVYVDRAMADAGRRPRMRYILGAAADEDLVGVVKLDLDGTDAVVSYILRADSWGRGHATDALRELLVMAFGKLGVASVRARHHLDNPASGRVLANAGFLPVGRVSGFETYVIRTEGKTTDE
ncbi:GNAT family N-acetyltransferase [Kitasatospora sp. NPDC093806]|uniref:GNAT family N-acetyltransferase n=1 Tax=Kitasatospora sp. NPDC093806 TaxID=3155075 RepID=UPI00342D0E21